jgi:hypothetical protein
MNARERFIATLSFQKPDRVPFMPGYGRKSTLEAWHRQGLPSDVTDYHGYLRNLLGITDPTAGSETLWPAVDFRMIPQYEEKVLAHRPGDPARKVPGVLVVQDWKGNICEISDEYDVTYLRHASDFVTRSWLKCPVESRADWPEMARRYHSDDPARFPADFARWGAENRARLCVSAMSISGPFWQLREWCGFEGLCMLMLDDPDFVQDMINFWEAFVTEMLQRMLAHHVPDIITINEDMAYKEKPMIGPDMARRFLLPCWRRWGELIRGAGVPIYDMDSDGHVGLLVPLWIEAGFNSNSPQEVAAGNDLPALARQYGRQMSWRGGVDKRIMAAGGQAIRDEMARLQPVIEAGGFIPSCDHGVPSDVSWPNFVEYSRLLANATGWLKA